MNRNEPLFQPSQVIPASVTQSIMYGLYILTFVDCLRWLMFEHGCWKLQPWKEMKWRFITIAILLFAISTADLCLTFQVARARLTGEDTQATRLGFLSVAIEGFSLIIVDAVLIFRCWTVYDNSWRVAFLPLLFWTCTITCAVTWTVCNAIGLDLINNPTAIAIGVGVFYFCNFATNVYATFAIVYRVWNTVIPTNKLEHSRLHEICRTIFGAGILYSLTSFVSLVTACWSIRDSFPLALASAINFPTACIVYNLVIIRGGQLRAATKDVLVHNSTCYLSDFTNVAAEVDSMNEDSCDDNVTAKFEAVLFVKQDDRASSLCH